MKSCRGSKRGFAALFPLSPYSSISPEWKEGLSSSSSSFPLSFKFTPIPQLTQKGPPNITQLVVRTALYTKGELRKKVLSPLYFQFTGNKINPPLTSRTGRR